MSARMNGARVVMVGVLVTALLPAACRDATAPPVEPSITLELQDAPGLVTDAMVRMRVTAQTPGRLHSVHVYDSTTTLTRILAWDRTTEGRDLFTLDSVLKLSAHAGPHVIYAVMRHDVAGVIASDTAFVRLEMYLRADFGFRVAVPDTVYGRSLIVSARVSPAISDWSLALVMDPGTPREKVMTGPGAPWEVVRSRVVEGGTHVEFDVTDTLSNGPHRVALRLTDGLGVRTVERDFVVHVAEARFSVRALPSLSSGDARARDVNDAGDAVGTSVNAAGTMRPMFWPRGGSAVELQTPGLSSNGAATAISSAGVVAGWVSDGSTSSCSDVPVAWEGGTMRQLQLPAGACGRAEDVNDAGAVVYRRNSQYPFWNDSATIIDEGGVATYVAGIAFPKALNPGGKVVGTRYYQSTSILLVPAANFAVSVEPLHRGAGHTSGAIAGVNDRSQVVGYRRTGNLTSVYLAEPGDPSLDLTPALGGPVIPAFPIWINEVGTVLAGDANAGFFLWSAGRVQHVALASPGWRLVALSRMNAAGQIAGQAREVATGALHAVILEPVP